MEATNLTLYIANKNYSSWSLRPWLAMHVAGINFTEQLRPFGPAQNFAEFSPSARVPALVHGALTIWESMAILEYVAELSTEYALWPEARDDRALARAVANEMHAGFNALREQCPMNMRRPPAPVAMNVDLQADVARIEQIWATCLERSGGPFLFGEFCNADAMFAPVVNRLRAYQLSNADAVTAYSQSMSALPAWQAWQTAALAETWMVPEDEL